MDYQIVADSGCDLSPALQKELGVSLVPFQVTIDGHHFIDDRNLDLEQMISEMRAYKKAPSTACASPEEYAALFEQSDVTFCLTLSSRLSGSFNSALVGRDIALSRHPDKFIHIFDSMSASAGETLVARKIYEFASTLSTPHEVVQKMEAFIAGMKTFFILESLENLMKNGRLSKITGHLATILSIKPIMGSDGNGEIKLFETLRGVQRAFSRLIDMVGEQCSNTQDKILTISHCNAEDRALSLKKDLESRYQFREILVNSTLGLSTVYANEGGVVVAF